MKFFRNFYSIANQFIENIKNKDLVNKLPKDIMIDGF